MVRGAKCDPDSCVFPGQSRGSSLSQMSMTMLLRRMKLGHYTVHGMRSSFRDYMGDMTHHAESTVEQRSEEHTSELQSLMRTSYAVFCLKNKKNPKTGSV